MFIISFSANTKENNSFYTSLVGTWKPKEDCEMKTAEKTEKIKYPLIKIEATKVKGKDELDIYYMDEKSKKGTKSITSYDTRFTKLNPMYENARMENMQFTRSSSKALLVGTVNKWEKDKMGLYFTSLSLNKDGILELNRTGITVEGFKDEMPELPLNAWQRH